MSRLAAHRRTAPGRFDERLWVVTVLFFGVGDVVTTGLGLSIAGVSETGPLVAVLFRQSGIEALVLLKLAMLGGCYLAWNSLPRPHRVGVPLGLAVLGVVVTLWNSRVILAALWL